MSKRSGLIIGNRAGLVPGKLPKFDNGQHPPVASDSRKDGTLQRKENTNARRT